MPKILGPLIENKDTILDILCYCSPAWSRTPPRPRPMRGAAPAAQRPAVGPEMALCVYHPPRSSYYGGSARAPVAPRPTRASQADAPAVSASIGPTQSLSTRGCKRPAASALGTECGWTFATEQIVPTFAGKEVDCSPALGGSTPNLDQRPHCSRRILYGAAARGGSQVVCRMPCAPPLPAFLTLTHPQPAQYLHRHARSRVIHHAELAKLVRATCICGQGACRSRRQVALFEVGWTPPEWPQPAILGLLGAHTTSCALW